MVRLTLPRLRDLAALLDLDLDLLLLLLALAGLEVGEKVEEGLRLAGAAGRRQGVEGGLMG